MHNLFFALSPAEREEACHCGYRRGLHRARDEACPNPAWRPGNGQEQWTTFAFLPRALALLPVGTPDMTRTVA